MRKATFYVSDDNQFQHADPAQVLAYEAESSAKALIERYVAQAADLPTERGQKAAMTRIIAWERWRAAQAPVPALPSGEQQLALTGVPTAVEPKGAPQKLKRGVNVVGINQRTPGDDSNIEVGQLDIDDEDGGPHSGDAA